VRKNISQKRRKILATQKGAEKMNYVLWLIAGAFLGWLTTMVIHNRRKDLLINIVVGVVGAFVVGYLLTPVFHFITIDQGIFSLPALFVSLLGAGILLAVVNFFRRENDVTNTVIDRRWEQVRTKIHTRWGKLTDQDITTINSHHDQFNVTLQERYGITQKEADDQMQRYFKARLYQ
jgi:uncharacterized membrane protein YeaQ/YmgE (transglycosylase-associated protein family)/uncharacterized protein YjbJ (UPF0337 family)